VNYYIILYYIIINTLSLTNKYLYLLVENTKIAVLDTLREKRCGGEKESDKGNH